MWLSLEFLYRKLNKKKSELLLNGRKNPVFIGVGIYSSTLELRADTVYVCPGNISCNIFEDEHADCPGVIWLGSQKPPETIPVLWIKDVWDYVQVFNEVLDIFQTFHRW